MYAWGANSYGQLGTGNKSNSSTPLRVAESVGKYISTYWYIYIEISGLIAYNANYSFVKRRECIFVVWYQVHTFSSNHNVYFVKIYDLNGLQPKNKGHTNFYEHCDLTKKCGIDTIPKKNGISS